MRIDIPLPKPPKKFSVDLVADGKELTTRERLILIAGVEMGISYAQYPDLMAKVLDEAS